MPSHEDPPALIPWAKPLTGAALRGRDDVVEKFKKWIIANPEQAADPKSTHQLSGVANGPLGYSRKKISTYFPDRECGGSAWNALCYMALQRFKPGVDPEPSAELRYWADRYAKQIQKAKDTATPAKNETSDLDHAANKELLRITNKSDDLNIVTTAARILTQRLHRKLSATAASAPPDAILTLDEATEAAHTICRVHKRVIDDLVWPARHTIDRDIKKNCAAINDATADARRLLSRDPRQETQQLYLILELRSRDVQLTEDEGVRTRTDFALAEYHRDHARSLLAGSHEDELRSAETLLASLHGYGAVAFHADAYGIGHAPPNAVDAEKLVFIGARIASYILAYEDLRPRAKACAEQLLSLFDPSIDHSVAPHCADVTALLHAADGARKIVGPVGVLRIIKFRGIGEILVARMLVMLAETETPTGATVEDDTDALYLCEPEPAATLNLDHQHQRTVSERRRGLLLERAVGLYERAIDWLRQSGVAGKLSEIAKQDLAHALELRDRRSMEFREIMPIEQAISTLRTDLDEMIVQGILLADLNRLTNLRDEVRSADALRLIESLAEALRYLKQPELGLRTDLSPAAAATPL